MGKFTNLSRWAPVGPIPLLVKRTLKNLGRAVLISLCTATSLGVVGAPGALATAAPTVTTAKGLTYMVKPGDSLIAIARRANVSLEELLKANGFAKTTVIYPGRSIKLPDTAAVPATSAGSSAQPTTYVVRAGDGLIAIARRAGVTLEELLKVNGFVKSTVILPGQSIKLPAGAVMAQASAVSAASATASATPAASSSSSSNDGLSSYTIQPGDSLIAISSKARVSLEELLSVNGFTRSTVIHPGQVIKLPKGAATPSTRVQTMIAYAMSQVGKPYLFGAAGPNSYDCSGLVTASFAKVSVAVPHQSRALAALGTPVDWRSTPIQPGDLVFTANSASAGGIGHVAIAISATEVVEALSAGKPVGVSRMPAKERILEVRRIL